MSFDEIVRVLSTPATHGAVAPVEVIETHAAMVFLTDSDAYKIKRPVRYDYLDFSTPEKRRAMLDHELELNRPFTPELYLGLVPITCGADGGLELDGPGEPIEWALHMRRFPKGAELSAVADRGEIDFGLAERIGRSIAEYHDRAPRRDADGQALAGEIADELKGAFAGMGDVLGDDAVARFNDQVAAARDRHGALLSARGRAGYVRRGHGDLHLGNMALLDGRPVPFDALEFDERLGTLDVLYDLAFMIMDLLHRDLRSAANAVLGSWLFRAGDSAHLDGLALLPLFLGLRAGIRAMVAVQKARLAKEGGEDGYDDARRYLAHALDHLAPPAPSLVAVGGVSGTGKTTLARGLAPRLGPAPGAVHLRSDLERKAMFGADPLTPLPEYAYSEAASRQVYARLCERAGRALSAGHSVVVDAVYSDAEERRALADVAQRCGVPLTGLWLRAGEETLVARVTARQGDASDADAGVVRRQLAREPEARDWVQIDASGEACTVLARASRALGLGGGGPA